jgi:dTMP kinase
VSGRYVAFEGIEGAGKSTVCRLVAAALTELGEPVLVVREPGGTPTGELIRDAVLNGVEPVAPWAEALLFAAARAQLTRRVVAPALAVGRWVLSDRSVYSSLAYQGVGRGLGVEEVRAINEPGLAAWPDVVVLLRVPASRGIERQHEPDRIGSEGHDFQQSVADGFDSLAAAEPDRFLVVDADQNVAGVVSEVLEELKERSWGHSTES